MTLEAKDKLIRDLIKENPDSTIRDYLELVKELESIEATEPIIPLVKIQGRDKNGRFDRNVWVPVTLIVQPKHL
jgi:hypothetical protein